MENPKGDHPHTSNREGSPQMWDIGQGWVTGALVLVA